MRSIKDRTVWKIQYDRFFYGDRDHKDMVLQPFDPIQKILMLSYAIYEEMHNETDHKRNM